MFVSALFLIAAMVLYIGVLLYPKTVGRVNLIKHCIISFLTIYACIAVLGCVMKLLIIPFNLITLTAVSLVANIILWYCIWKKKQIQKFYIHYYDVYVVLVLTSIFLILFQHMFGFDLRLTYLNSDIANHFDMAMDMVRNETIASMFMAPFFNAILIMVCEPFLEQAYLFQPFIVGDAIINYCLILIFYVLILSKIKNKVIKIFAPLFGILFFMGYPLYSYVVGGFVYWTLGVVFIGYLIYIMELYLYDGQKKILYEILMMISCTAIGFSYSIFAPISFVAVFFVILLKLLKNGTLFTIENIHTFLRVFLLPMLGLFAVLIVMWFGDLGTASKMLLVDGGIYSSVYSDFIFFIPFTMYMFLYCVKERKIDVTSVFLIVFIIATGIGLVLCYMEVISKYYYYKLYYPLWILCWILSIKAICLLVKEKNSMLYSYFTLIIFLVFIQFTGMEEKIIEKIPNIQIEETNNQYFYLYKYSYYYAKNGFAGFQPKDDEKWELCEYVIEHLRDIIPEDKVIPMVSTRDFWIHTMWYDAITGEYSLNYYPWKYEEDKEVFNNLDNNTQYFVILKESDFYVDNLAVLEKYKKIFENNKGVIYQTQ